MRVEQVQVFTDREEEIFRLFTEIGLPPHVAMVLVFLARSPEASSREIERSLVLGQPAVSIAMKKLKASGWVQFRLVPGADTGRPVIIYTLARSLPEILVDIRNEKTEALKQDLARISKIRKSL